MRTDSNTANEIWPIDAEWVTLVVRAKEIGLTIQEIREFLQKAVNLNAE